MQAGIFLQDRLIKAHLPTLQEFVQEATTSKKLRQLFVALGVLDAILRGQILLQPLLVHANPGNGLVPLHFIHAHPGPLNTGIGNHPGHFHSLAMAQQAILNSLLNLEGI